MKKSKCLLFLSLPLLLTSCSNPGTTSKNSLTSSSDENEIKTANIPLTFVFEHVYDGESNIPLASLLYQSNYLSDDFDEVEIPQDLIAGDLLNIEYTGEIIAAESYPGTLYLDGEIISYNFEKTKIIEIDIKEDLLTIDNLSQSYILENEFVILNKNYQYLKLEDYTGDKLYLSVDLSEVTKSIDSIIYGLDIYHISGIYAYNPRQN